MVGRDEPVAWGAIFYRWLAEDMEFRVAFARTMVPTDFFTLTALWIVRKLTALLAIVLVPFDVIARLIGAGLVRVVIGLFVLMAFDAVWSLIWGLLVGTSWLWLRSPWYRPALFLPGMALAVVALVFIKLAPDPHKQPSYTSLVREWPLTWHIWRPPDAYFESRERP